MNGRLWSSKELDEIGKLLEKDGSISALARRLGRTPSAILFKAQQLSQQND